MNRLFVFFTLAALLLAIDYYLFQAVKVAMRNFTPTTQRWITYFYWAIPVLAMTVTVLGFYMYPAYLSYKTRNLLAASVFLLYISKVIAVPFLVLDDLGRLGRWVISLFQKNNPAVSGDMADAGNSISRSDFLAKTAVAVTSIHAGALAWGIISGAHDYRIRRVKLPLKNLPKQFDGMKLAQLSDIHSGSFFNKTAVRGGVEMLMREKPDAVFFTGDLVNNEAKEVQEYIDIFSKVKAPLGVFSTLGNHDYGDYVQWSSAAEKVQNLNNLKEAHRLMGWDLLLDENRKLTVDGESIGVLGIQNWGAGFAQYGNLGKALQNTDDLPVKLLLSHDPSHWREQVLGKTNIDASFAGHTHGMQYGVEIGGFRWSPVQYRYKEWAGLYSENNQNLYVNRGFGYLGYPGRLGILPEITIVELVKA